MAAARLADRQQRKVLAGRQDQRLIPVDEDVDQDQLKVEECLLTNAYLEDGKARFEWKTA